MPDEPFATAAPAAPELPAYGGTRHPTVSPDARDGYINVGNYFEVSPASARALAAALVCAAEARESRCIG